MTPPAALDRRQAHRLIPRRGRVSPLLAGFTYANNEPRWARGTPVAQVLLQASTGWNLHQLRHSAATHLGDKGVPLQLIMAKTRHKSPRTAMRYVNPGPAAVAEVTELLNPPKRTH